MGSAIKRLPESVRNTVRSGIMLYDLTQVVEELVLNSLDAGAKKVLVYVGVSTCYVKVVDDGCGIDRDGLVLLGERYATSKGHYFGDVGVPDESFGYRGEALASISDVSLLDIVTKSSGRPNGYRKVVKGSKGLYLGIDDRKDVGTTVSVRDLFYNQPVRRKCMQSSPKKALHSVRKCVLRIALVHAKISFKVIDIESEDELLYTRPSSMLSLLMSSFGIANSSSLRELNVSDGALKLSGYLSGPSNSFPIKAFQYVYINSRFVCKGPVHKLLNHLDSRFECLDPWKVKGASQKSKRRRPQACPAYIINLCCPSSLYHLSFEPSKTHAEFKDWVPILTFIEKAIKKTWEESMVNAAEFRKEEILEEGGKITSVEEDFNHADLSNEITLKNCEIQNGQSSFHLPSSPLDMLTNEIEYVFSQEHDNVPLQKFYMNDPEYKEQRARMESFRPEDYSLSNCTPRVAQTCDSHLLAADSNFFLAGDCFLENRFSGRQTSHIDLGGCFQDLNNVLDVHESSKNSFLKSCSLQRSLEHNRALFASENGFEFQINASKAKRRRACADENTYNLEVDIGNQRFDIFPRALQQDEVSCVPQFRVGMATDFDLVSGASVKSFSPQGNPFAKSKGLSFDSVMHVESSGSGACPLSSEWCSLTSDVLFQGPDEDVEHFPDDDASNGCALMKRANYWRFADSKVNDCKPNYDITPKSSSQNNCISSCPGDSTKGTWKLLEGQDLYSVGHSDIPIGEADWLLLDSHLRGHKSEDKYERRGHPSRISDWEQKERPRRGYSAPPFYRHKRRFISLYCHSVMKGHSGSQLSHDGIASQEANDLKHPCFPRSCAEDLVVSTSPNVKNGPDIVANIKEIPKDIFEHSQSPQERNVEGFMTKETQESIHYGAKWRNSYQHVAKNKISCKDNEHNILDISSGFLHLAGNSLVPESIHKNCLEGAKVLQQVDKKFIPVVAGGTLVVIDQHAADERIRLEELRQKVLSGEARTVSYLDEAQELCLPEMGFQLLHNYAEQIRDWGWICNIHTHCSGNFKKNLNILHQQPTVVTLLAVPCILGVNLSEGDLLEFIRQLAETDGSSTLPPSVIRVLNFKACRGAIMFGDSLLPSECALIVEELKQTSLCFQCAHGRPTTAPLVNLESLHRQVGKLGLSGDGSNEAWHGLSRQEMSLERAAQRLSVARGWR